jgi:hypothetical protein
MLDWLTRVLGVSTTVAALVVVLVVVQVATQVYALVDLARRDAIRGGVKWVWALIVAAGGLPGAIAYLVAGRLTAEVDASAGASDAGAGSGEAARRALDALYGPGDRR